MSEKKPWEETWTATWRANAGYDRMTSGTEIVSSGGREIVTVDHGWRDAEQRDSDGGEWKNPKRDADAALIAAAPELYSALDTALAVLALLSLEGRRDVPAFDSLTDAMRMALRKARGEA